MTVIAYKGLKRDLTCKGFKYPVGEWVEFPEVKLCEAGCHACLDPLDAFKYYAPADSVYYEVELDDVSDARDDDSKVVARRARLIREISLEEIRQKHADYVKAHCTEEKNASNCSSVAAGNYSIVAAGNYSIVVSRGKSDVGENGIACARGNGCRVKGGMGAVLVVAEENNDDCDIAAWKAVVVDGENVKPDTWYALVNGELTEVSEDE